MKDHLVVDAADAAADYSCCSYYSVAGYSGNADEWSERSQDRGGLDM